MEGFFPISPLASKVPCPRATEAEGWGGQGDRGEGWIRGGGGMYMYVYICICLYVCMHVVLIIIIIKNLKHSKMQSHIYVYIYACMYTYVRYIVYVPRDSTCLCMYICTSVCMYIIMYICTSVYVYICIYVCIYMYVYVYSYSTYLGTARRLRALRRRTGCGCGCPARCPGRRL
jgi:hypothetical protein